MNNKERILIIKVISEIGIIMSIQTYEQMLEVNETDAWGLPLHYFSLARA